MNNPLERKLIARFYKAISEFKLIEDRDNILVGLSGGKDSLLLVELLAQRMRIQKPAFKVEAIHVKMQNIDYLSSTSYMEKFCSSLNVPLHIVTTAFEKSSESRKPNCFLCSWMRRKEMFVFAQANGFNKIALGHHMDDIIHTALMNAFYQGHFSTMPIRLKMRKMPLTIIRPLGYEHETDIQDYAQQNGYIEQLKKCPYEQESQRQFVKQLFNKLEQHNPETRYSLWNALRSEGKLCE